MMMLEYKSPTLLVKLCLKPLAISLTLEGWDLSLFTFNQSVTFTKSELISLASSTESREEVKIWVSFVYRQCVVVFGQLGKSAKY